MMIVDDDDDDDDDCYHDGLLLNTCWYRINSSICIASEMNLANAQIQLELIKQ